MTTFRNVFAVFLAAIMLCAASLAVAADAKKPDGTVAIEETDFAVMLGGSIGGGVLYVKNEHGVVLKLKERSGGLQLNVASARGVKITMK
jgi:hypothetical protein